MSEEKNYTKCENCGAPIDRTSDHCPYCRSQYPYIGRRNIFNIGEELPQEENKDIDINAPVETKRSVKGLNPILAIILFCCVPPIGIAYIAICVVGHIVKTNIKKD